MYLLVYSVITSGLPEAFAALCLALVFRLYLQHPPSNEMPDVICEIRENFGSLELLIRLSCFDQGGHSVCEPLVSVTYGLSHVYREHKSHT